MENSDTEKIVVAITKINFTEVEKPEPPTAEEKLEHYFQSGFLIRLCFGKPDSSVIIQGIRGFICAVILWVLIFLTLYLIIVATDIMF